MAPPPAPGAPPYESVNPLLFRELVGKVRVDRSTAVFVDYGAGKGRAMLLAASCGFRTLVGVELSPALCEQARSNLAHALRRRPAVRFEVHACDATTFTVPDEANLLFFFNPFGEETMRQVLRSVDASMKRKPRELHAVYVHPVYLGAFIECGFQVLSARGKDGAVLRRDDRASAS